MTTDGADDATAPQAGRTLSKSELLSLTNAGHVRFWDYDSSADVVCQACGWTGRGGDNENHYRDLFDITCPDCECMLFVIAYPNDDDTRAAASAGNKRAIEAMEGVTQRAEHRKFRDAHELTMESELPDLDGDALVIDWTMVTDDTGSWTVLLHGGAELWREPVYYEGVERFRTVAAILQARYKDRLVEVRPSPESTLYLYGDLSAAFGVVDAINKALQEHRPV